MIQIDVWSDINCPFCYIGKRHLESALLKVGSPPIKLEWKSFELDPHANPPAGADNTELLAKKYNRDRSWAEEMNANMTQMAANIGLEFHMEKIKAANSFNAHRLLHLAKKFKLQDQMKEKLLKAKFTDGLDIANIAILSELAHSIGLDRVAVMNLFESDQFSAEVRKDEHQAAVLGIRGVPFFVFNQNEAFSGAQPVETFIKIIEKHL